MVPIWISRQYEPRTTYTDERDPWFAQILEYDEEPNSDQKGQRRNPQRRTTSVGTNPPGAWLARIEPDALTCQSNQLISRNLLSHFHWLILQFVLEHGQQDSWFNDSLITFLSRRDGF